MFQAYSMARLPEVQPDVNSTAHVRLVPENPRFTLGTAYYLLKARFIRSSLSYQSIINP